MSKDRTGVLLKSVGFVFILLMGITISVAGDARAKSEDNKLDIAVMKVEYKHIFLALDEIKNDVKHLLTYHAKT